MHLAHEPFVVLYTLVPFIVWGSLGASLAQMAVLSSLRPVLPIFSFYGSFLFSGRKHFLKYNLIGSWILARAPFLIAPYIDNAWYLIFCAACYELFHKSSIPALMEVAKISMSAEAMKRIYTTCYVLSFSGGILCGAVLMLFLDHPLISLRSLLGIAALVSLTSIFAQTKIKLSDLQKNASSCSWKEKIFSPWKEAFLLLKKRPDFARFQQGFMIGGFGLMLAAPVIPIFFTDILHFSNSKITMGRSILVGIGVAIASYLWKKYLHLERINKITTYILLGFSCYLIFLYSSIHSIYWFYIAYFIYGVAQAGSHLLWNLSGPLFSGNADSAPFSRINILMVGIRGCIAPAMGGILCKYFGPLVVILLGSGVCFFGVCYMKFNVLALRLFGYRLKKKLAGRTIGPN